MSLVKVFMCFFIFYSLTIASELKKVTVQLNWKHQFEHAGFYAAIDKGFYNDVGLEVHLVEKQSGKSTFDEVMNKNADFAVGYSSLILDYYLGNPVVLLASIFQHSPLVFLAKQDSNIRTVSDMLGKRVMINPKSKSSASLNIMLRNEGLSYDEMTLLDHSYSTKDLINGKTDVLSAYISNQPFDLISKGITYNVIDPVNYGFDFYENIIFSHKDLVSSNPELVNNFLSATLKGWRYALDNENEIIDLILEKYTKVKSKEALKYEANIIKKSLISKNIPIGNISENRILRIINLYDELGFINEKSVNIKDLIYNYDKIKFSKEQQDWISKNPQVYFSGNPNWLPYEAFIDGKYIGVVSEHLNLIEEYTGLKFIKVPTVSWSESINFARKKYIDVLSETTSSILKNELSFTKSYLSSPIVMVMKKSESYKNSIFDILDKKIAVIKDYGYVSEVKRIYPDLNYKEVDNIQDGLLSIENEELDVLLCALPQASYWINKYSLQNVRIVGKTKFEASLAFGVRSDYKILVEILNKAISKIPQIKQQDILNSWTKVKYKQKVDYTMLWVVLIITFSIILLLFFRHKALSNHNKELTHLSEVDPLTKIYNRAKLNSLLYEQLNLFKRYKITFGIIILDIDHFKSVNDTYGHNIGDSVLVEFVNILKDNIRDVDYLGRWGGEEFLVVCPRIDEIGIMEVARKLRNVINAHSFKKVGKKTASFGLTVCTKETSIKELIKNADNALYQVKHNGRDGITFS